MKHSTEAAVPARLRRRVVFDVSTLFIWDRPPVGIVRVQYELASYLLTQNRFPVAFVRFSPERMKLDSTPSDVVSRRLEEMAHAGSTLAARRGAERIAIQKVEQIEEFAHGIEEVEAMNFAGRARTITKAGLKLLVPKSQRKHVRAAWNVYRSAGAAAVLKKLKQRAFKRAADPTPVAAVPESVSAIPPPPVRSLEVHVPEVLNSARTTGDFMSRDDVFVSAGLDWDHSNYELLYWMKRRVGFGFTGVCYDTIPIEYPEFANSLDFPQKFFNHFYLLHNLADRIACISDYTRSRCLAVAQMMKFQREPVLQTILMGDQLAKKIGEAIPQTRALPDRYVLYVSSIEARKNHETLLTAWQRAVEENLSMPDLVCVGMRGWGVDHMFERYESHEKLRSKVHFLTDVDDPELSGIYQKSLFCVFPSHVEGWGLGAAEAMTYGKMCIVSAAPALIEATRGMMPAVEAKNSDAWLDAVLYWASNEDLRSQTEEKIRSEFVPKKWSDYAEEFFNFALSR